MSSDEHAFTVRLSGEVYDQVKAYAVRNGQGLGAAMGVLATRGLQFQQIADARNERTMSDLGRLSDFDAVAVFLEQRDQQQEGNT